MNPAERPAQKLPFAAESDSRQFMIEVMQAVIKGFDEESIVPPANVLILYHGKGWNSQIMEKDGFFKPRSGELGLVSNQCFVHIDRILAHDMNLVSDFIRETARVIGQSLSQRTLTAMMTAAEETGQTTLMPKSGSLADAFLEMVKKTDMSVDSAGRVSLPKLFFPAEMISRLNQEIAARGPDFEKQIDDTRKEKEQQALEREAARLARYDSP